MTDLLTVKDQENYFKAFLLSKSRITHLWKIQYCTILNRICGKFKRNCIIALKRVFFLF